MKKLLAFLVLLSACAGSPPEPLPDDDAPRGRTSSRERTPEAAPGALTLDRALELAERLHPELSQARARVEAVEGRALQAALLPNPTLLAKAESIPFEDGDAELLAGFSQRIAVGGRLGAAREAERLEGERLRREFEVRLTEIRSRVHGAFATALFAAEVARLQSETLEFARRAVVVALARREAGDAALDEVARFEMEEIRARLEEDKTEGLHRLALVALASALGDSGYRIEALEGKAETALELPALESVLEALGKGPHAALAKADVEAARARVDLAKVERIPDVTLDLFYRRITATESDAFDVGLSLPLPLFDRNQGRLQEAEAGRRAAESRAAASRDDALRRVREAHIKLAEALHHVRLGRDELLPKSETVLRAAEARHAEGDLSLADLLPLRREAAAVRLAYLEGLREVMEAWGELRLFLKP